jgi:hypothetical protein
VPEGGVRLLARGTGNRSHLPSLKCMARPIRREDVPSKQGGPGPNPPGESSELRRELRGRVRGPFERIAGRARLQFEPGPIPARRITIKMMIYYLIIVNHYFNFDRL